MNLFSWWAGCWLFTAAVCAAIVQTHLTGLRQWAPQEPATFTQARTYLDAQPIQAAGHAPEFDLPAGRAVWFALELPPLPQASVLELSHPSLRSAELYLPERGAQPVAIGGREVPGEARVHHRFPVTLPLPASTEPRTAFLRVQSPVRSRGLFVLQPAWPWELYSRLQLAAMSLLYLVPALAIVYALGRATALRSGAYLYYCLLTTTLLLAGLVLTGLGEATLWSALSPWRGQMASLLACAASGLALLLAQRAFALDISAPRFARWLLVLGIACPLAGLLALPLPLPTQQLISHVAAAAAMAMGLASIWMAWRTHNGPAAWLLAGYVPVVIAVAAMTLCVAGVLPFAPWTLLVMPVAGLLEIPFNLRGLRLLEERRAEVRWRRAQLDELAGHADETRDEMAQRMALPRADAPVANPGATLMLLRFTGLATGSPNVRGHDSVALEKYFQQMMAACLRPGIQVGRWSYNEILVRDLHHAEGARLDGMLTGLFAEALRSERFGIPSAEPRLRIATVRCEGAPVPVLMLARQLSRALDDPAQQDARRIALETWEV